VILNSESLHEHTSQGGVNCYLLAVLLTATAVVARYAIEAVIGSTSDSFSVLVTLAAFAAAWYGGFKAGFLATFLGSFCFYFCFVTPRYTLIYEQSNDVLSVMISGVCGIIGSRLCESLHDAHRRVVAASNAESRARSDAEAWRERYEAAVKASRSVLYDCDRRSKQVVYGGDCESVLGYTATELNGDISKWIALVHPEDRSLFLQKFDRAHSACTSFQAYYRMIRRDGGIVWMRDDGHLADEKTNSQPFHAIGFVKDVTDQRLAQQQLRQNEEQLTSLLEQLPIGVGIIGLDGMMVLQNPIMRHYIPTLTASLDLERRHRWQAWKPDGSPLPPEDWPGMRALRGERVVPGIEFLFTEDDGRQVWIILASSPLRDVKGAVIGAISVIEDIDVRKRVEDELRRSEQFNRSLMDGSTDCVNVLDIDGRLLLMNGPAARFAGFDDPALHYGQRWESFWPPEARNDVRRAIETAAGGGVYKFEVFCPAVKGAPKWWEVTASPVRESTKELTRSLLLISRDITVQRHIDNQLRSSERRFRAVLEHQFQFSALLTPDGRIEVISSSALKIAGVSHEALVGKPFVEAPWFRGMPDVQEIWRQQFTEAIAEGSSPTRREVPYHRPDGSVRWSINTVSAIRNDEGIVEYLLAEGIDITERKQSEDNLKESDRKKDEFLATLAHELRNPLASIRYAVKIVSLARGNLDAVDKAVAMVDHQAGHMARLIDDLMDLSRVSRGIIVLQKMRLLVADILQDAIDISRPLIDERGHEFVVIIPPEPLYVDGDRTRLVQVLCNLLNNAAIYTEKRGRIRLAVEQQANEVVIAIEDTGVGIPEDMLDKVFDMFTQLAQPQTNQRSGLGIGLNITKRLVEMHHGSIVAESAGSGNGSRFTVRLHLVLNGAADMADFTNAPTGKHIRRRILVVDDDRNVADGLAEMLRFTGHDTQVAYGGHEGVAAAEAFHPDMILMDIGMPELNGYEACRKIREMPWGRQLMIVADSGWGQESDKQKTEDAGFDGHMVKSANPAAIERLLEKLELKMANK